MCLDDQILSTYVDGELEDPWKTLVEEHLSYCNGCKNRLEDLKKLSRTVKDAVLSESEIQKRKEKISSLLENNYLNKQKKSFFDKIIRFSMKQIACSAAAFVIVFAGAWTVLARTGKSEYIPVPEIGTAVDINSIRYVSDTLPQEKTLDDFDLEEILKNLDARGYDVDIRLKGIKPIDFE